MSIISREDAFREGYPRYFTGVPCKHGHVCERVVINQRCVECEREQARGRRKVKIKKADRFQAALTEIAKRIWP